MFVLPAARLIGGLVLSCIFLSFLAKSTSAETYRIGPQDDWFAKLSEDGLQPGDEIVLQGGVYADARRLLIAHRGTAEQPIVIRGGEGGRVIFRRPDARQNTFNLEGVQHLRLQNFEITGGAAGIRISPRGDEPIRDITLEQLHIHHIGGVAVTCNHSSGNYERMTFRKNHIHHTSGHGEAFYLGGNHASAILHDSVVELNYLHDLRGPKVSQGDGVELKQGSYGNRVFGNVIHDTNYPGVIVYGTAGMPPNVVENNLIWNSGDHGIQAAADARIVNNFIAHPAAVGIYSRNHQEAVTGNLTIRNNVILAGRSGAIRIQRPDGGDYSGPVEIAENLLIAEESQTAVRVDASDQLTFRANQGSGRIEGIRPGEKDWQSPAATMPPIPQLEGNPAWNHLDRAAVQAVFAPADN